MVHHQHISTGPGEGVADYISHTEDSSTKLDSCRHSQKSAVQSIHPVRAAQHAHACVCRAGAILNGPDNGTSSIG